MQRVQQNTRKIGMKKRSMTGASVKTLFDLSRGGSSAGAARHGEGGAGSGVDGSHRRRGGQRAGAAGCRGLPDSMRGTGGSAGMALSNIAAERTAAGTAAAHPAAGRASAGGTLRHVRQPRMPRWPPGRPPGAARRQSASLEASTSRGRASGARVCPRGCCGMPD